MDCKTLWHSIRNQISFYSYQRGEKSLSKLWRGSQIAEFGQETTEIGQKHFARKHERQQQERRAYFRGSESSTDNFLVFANCSTAEVPRLFSDIDWTQSGSGCDCPIALETPARSKQYLTCYKQSAALILVFAKVNVRKTKTVDLKTQQRFISKPKKYVNVLLFFKRI